MSGHKFDEIDRHILEILQDNAKTTNAKLSQDVGLSPAPTLERVKKLEQAGVLKSYHAVLDKEKIGLGVTTFVQITLQAHRKQYIDDFVRDIMAIDEVIECHHVTGNGDFLLKITCTDIPAYQRFILEKISEIPSVADINTIMVLSTFKDSKILPIPKAFTAGDEFEG